MSAPKKFTPVTLEDDSNFGDYVKDIHQNDKRHVRVTVKNYPTNGTYIFLKVFKFRDGEFQRHQYISLTSEEFNLLKESMSTISKQLTSNCGESEEEEEVEAESTSKPPAAKKPKKSK